MKQNSKDNPQKSDQLWFENFQIIIFTAKTFQILIVAIIFCFFLIACYEIYDFISSYSYILMEKFDSKNIKVLLNGLPVLGVTLLKIIAIIIFFSSLRFILMRLPIPDRVLFGWANDPDMLTTTASLLVNSFRYNHKITLSMAMEDDRVGKIEHKGNGIIKSRKGMSALEKASLKNK